jgi:DNA-binding transcriptional MerR regulator
MKMKEVIAQTGIPEKTVRYYEARGLIHPETQRRNGRTYHEFSVEDVEALKSILSLRQAQFSIEEILTIQQSPEKIPETVAACQARIQAVTEAQTRLLSTPGLSEAADWQALAHQAHRALSGADAYESPMHFGLGDPETEEEKQAAIAAFQEKKPFPVKNTAIILLSVLCLILSVSLGYLIAQKIRTVPATTGSTEGWEYYLSEKGLMRSRSDGSEESLIYEKDYDTQSLSYLVAEDKIYLIAEKALYSINADGSGTHQYHPKYYSGYSGTPLLLGDHLFLTEYQSGTFGSNSCIVAVSVDGSGETKVVDTSEWNSCSLWCWGDRLYLLYCTQEDMELRCYDPETLKVTDTFGSDEVLLAMQSPYASQTFSMEPGCADAEAAYFLDMGSENTNVYRITPEDLTGELVYQVPGDVWYMQAPYVAYQKPDQTDWLLNLDTGAETEIGSLALPLSFTSTGLRIGGRAGTTETTLIPYP